MNKVYTSTEVQKRFLLTKQRLHQLRVSYHREGYETNIWRTDLDEAKLVIPTDYFKKGGRFFYTEAGVRKIRKRLLLSKQSNFATKYKNLSIQWRRKQRQSES